MINYFPCSKAVICTYRLIPEIYSMLDRGKKIECVPQYVTNFVQNIPCIGGTAQHFGHVVHETLFGPKSPKTTTKCSCFTYDLFEKVGQ